MKVIDLLNKIANDEEVPKTIYYCGRVFEWTGLNYYCKKTDDFLDRYICLEDLNYEVEIIEDIPVSKLYINNELQYSLEEEHKIPEKWQHWYNPKAIEDFKLARFNSNDMKEICKTIGFLMEHTNTIKTKLDEIIDYLKENK